MNGKLFGGLKGRVVAFPGKKDRHGFEEGVQVYGIERGY
jgi:hypothetical protein